MDSFPASAIFPQRSCFSDQDQNYVPYLPRRHLSSSSSSSSFSIFSSSSSSSYSSSFFSSCFYFTYFYKTIILNFITKHFRKMHKQHTGHRNNIPLLQRHPCKQGFGWQVAYMVHIFTTKKIKVNHMYCSQVDIVSSGKWFAWSVIVFSPQAVIRGSPRGSRNIRDSIHPDRLELQQLKAINNNSFLTHQ